MFREFIISYSFMNKKRCYAMSDFFSGKEMSFILILTFSVYIFVWNVPLQATNAMMIYFILLFLYTVSKLLFSPQFRQFPLVKVLLAILFVLMLAEIIVAYSTHSIKITDLNHIFDYFSHMDLYSQYVQQTNDLPRYPLRVLAVLFYIFYTLLAQGKRKRTFFDQKIRGMPNFFEQLC